MLVRRKDWTLGGMLGMRSGCPRKNGHSCEVSHKVTALGGCSADCLLYLPQQLQILHVIRFTCSAKVLTVVGSGQTLLTAMGWCSEVKPDCLAFLLQIGPLTLFCKPKTKEIIHFIVMWTLISLLIADVKTHHFKLPDTRSSKWDGLLHYLHKVLPTNHFIVTNLWAVIVSSY